MGSSATMLECMNHLASLKLLSVDELIKVGFYNPLKLIGVEAAQVDPLKQIEFDVETNSFVLSE